MVYVLLSFIKWVCWLMCWKFISFYRDRRHCNQLH